MAGFMVHFSGFYEPPRQYDASDYFGDYDIVVAKAHSTDEPILKTKPASFSWADTWHSDADFMYVEVGSEAPAGYYLADQSWIDTNWVKVNATYSTLAWTLAYDGGYLVAPATGGGVREWEYPNSFSAYKSIRPGGIYVYALVVEATYDGQFEFSDLPVKPSDYDWTGDVVLIPAYEEIPFGYYAADSEFMGSQWA